MVRARLRPRALLARRSAPRRPRAGAARVAGCRGRRAGPRRGGFVAADAALAAGSGLPRCAADRARRRREQRRNRRGRRAAGPRASRRRVAPDRVDAPAAARLGRQDVGGRDRRACRVGPRRGTRVLVVHRCRRRARPGQSAPAGGEGRGGTSRSGVADGAAARGWRLGRAAGAGVRLLLPAALPVPACQRSAFADGCGGRRLCPGAPHRPDACRRHRGAARRGDRRLRARPRGEARRIDLARTVDRRTLGAAVCRHRGCVADGGAQRLHAVAILAGLAGRLLGGAPAVVRRAAAGGARVAVARRRGGRRARRRRVGADGRELRADPRAVRPCAALGLRAAARRHAVRRDDDRFRAPLPPCRRRHVERPCRRERGRVRIRQLFPERGKVDESNPAPFSTAERRERGCRD